MVQFRCRHQSARQKGEIFLMKPILKKNFAFVISIITIILEIIGFIIRPKLYDLPPIAFFTVISNCVALFSSIMLIIGLITKKFSKWMTVIRYTAVIMLAVTFLIVFFVLIWFVSPYELLIAKHSCIQHIIVPLISFISYFFFEDHVQSKKAVIPFMAISVIYCVIIVTLNALNKIDGPYPFFMTNVFGLPLVILFCCLIAFAFLGLALLLVKITSIYDKKHS